MIDWYCLQEVHIKQIIELIFSTEVACIISYPESELLCSSFSWISLLTLPVCESCAAAQLDFHCWHSLHELSSRMWVMCSCSAWFPLLTFPAWTSIQDVSHVQLLSLISIADISCMNSHPGCESCAAAQLGFHCWHFLHELSSSKLVMCSCSAWFPLLTFLAWTPIQQVSHVQLLCLISIADIPCMNSHLACESCAAALLDFHCWYSLHELPSSLWVMCSCSAWFPLLTFPAWTPIQCVSHVQLLCLISIADIPCMNSHLVCESCAAALLDFHCWHSLHELPSSEWVMCSCSAWFSLLTFTAW